MKKLSTIMGLFSLSCMTSFCKSRPVEPLKKQLTVVSKPISPAPEPEHNQSAAGGPGPVINPIPPTPVEPMAPAVGNPANPVVTNPVDSSPMPPAPALPLPLPLPTPMTPVPPMPGKPPLSLVYGLDPSTYFIRTGKIVGYAGDKNNPDDYFDIKIFLDGDNKTGKLVGTTKAERTGPDAGLEGEHALYFEVPKEFRDSKPHKVNIYAVINGLDVLLNAKAPYNMTFFSPKGGQAEALYNASGLVKGCGCHGLAYEDRWEMMSRNGSNAGWSANNNFLYNRIQVHMRGSIQNTDLVNWWKAEFGP